MMMLKSTLESKDPPAPLDRPTVFLRYKAFTSQGYGKNQAQRPLYMLHDEEDLPSLHSQRAVGHTNGHAI